MLIGLEAQGARRRENPGSPFAARSWTDRRLFRRPGRNCGLRLICIKAPGDGSGNLSARTDVPRTRAAEMPEQKIAERMWRAEDGLHVDVRGLPCPEPLVTVLRLIDGGAVEDVLIAHLSQEPMLLYPELDERGWRRRVIASAPGGAPEEGHVVVEIVRPGA